MNKRINIIVPMAGAGKSFMQAGYMLPKPLIEVSGKSMIERVIENLSPKLPHEFIFICRKDQYERYPFAELFHATTNGYFDVMQVVNLPQGAACTVLRAIDLINNDDELIVANADQIVDRNIDEFINFARKSNADGAIITFEASHPKWSFARIGKNFDVIETAEKRVISNHATVGIYYFRKGSIFVDAVLSMIEKDIRFNNEFYVCPAFNEIILRGGKVVAWEIDSKRMHSMGTAEDLAKYLHFLELQYNKTSENHRTNGRKRVKISSSLRPKPRVQKT